MPVPTPPKAPLTYAPIPSHEALHPPMPRPKQPRKPPTPPKPKCRCTNHMGTPKQQFKSKDDALREIVKRHMWTGKQFTVYECPASSKFHIASNGKFKKPRRHDRPD